MRILSILGVTLVALVNGISSVQAQTIYCVRAAATGNNTGSDWDNAYQSLPPTLVRGAIYYIAEGGYPAYTFDDPLSGTNRIVVRKASTPEHGPAAGWRTEFEQGPAIFRAPTKIQTSYVTIDGVRRESWKTGYGIRISNYPQPIDEDVLRLSGGNITVRFTEIEGSRSVDDQFNENGVRITSGSQNLRIESCAIIDPGLCNFFIRGASNTTIEHCYVARNDSSSEQHSEAVSASEGVNDFHLRFNWWEDIEGTAYIATPSGIHHQIRNWYIYGNVFSYSPENRNKLLPHRRQGVGNGVVSVFDCDVSGDFFVFNNSIVNLSDAAVGGSDWTASDIWFDTSWPTTAQRFHIRNNLWYDSTAVVALRGRSSISDFQWSHNSYFNTAASDSDPNRETNSGDPFVNRAGGDFRLAAATLAGADLGASFSGDPDGRMRGSDGRWDRGMYEFSPLHDTNAPFLSSVRAANVADQSAEILWTTDEPARSRAEYGRAEAFEGVVSNSLFTTSHRLVLSNLSVATTYNFRVQSSDASGNAALSPIHSFTTKQPDTVAPSVTLTSPLPGEVLSGVIKLSVTATDNTGIRSVRYFINDQPLESEVTNPPFSANWSSLTVPNGIHRIAAQAVDLSENSTLSATVTVEVKNAVRSGLAAYWAFDEGVGFETADRTGQGASATLDAGITWRAGKIGPGALEFGPSGNGAIIADSPALRMAGNMALSAWVNHSALPTDGKFMYYIEKGESDRDNFAWGAFGSAAGVRLFFEYEDINGEYQFKGHNGGPVLRTGVWSHVAVVFDGNLGSITFFLNASASSIPLETRLNGNIVSPLYIGAQNFQGLLYQMVGQLDDVRLYNRALSAPEVQELFGMGRPGAPANFRVMPVP